MNEQRFEGLTRQAAPANPPRPSLLALGGAALAAALAAPGMTEARKKPARKKPARKAGKKRQRACSQSEEQCRFILAANDEGGIIPCCDRCLASDFLICLFEVQG